MVFTLVFDERAIKLNCQSGTWIIIFFLWQKKERGIHLNCELIVSNNKTF